MSPAHRRSRAGAGRDSSAAAAGGRLGRPIERRHVAVQVSTPQSRRSPVRGSQISGRRRRCGWWSRPAGPRRASSRTTGERPGLDAGPLAVPQLGHSLAGRRRTPAGCSAAWRCARSRRRRPGRLAAKGTATTRPARCGRGPRLAHRPVRAEVDAVRVNPSASAGKGEPIPRRADDAAAGRVGGQIGRVSSACPRRTAPARGARSRCHPYRRGSRRAAQGVDEAEEDALRPVGEPPQLAGRDLPGVELIPPRAIAPTSPRSGRSSASADQRIRSTRNRCFQGASTSVSRPARSSFLGSPGTHVVFGRNQGVILP